MTINVTFTTTINIIINITTSTTIIIMITSNAITLYYY